MTFSDLIKEIIDSSKDRIKNPISGAYILSFLLWNWRPIALLLFEKATITSKIIIINSEYCNIMAMVGPFLLGVFFTVGIPHIMTLIDVLLVSANKKRLKTIYLAKTDELSEQIKLVVLELELQDKKNRSKTTEDFEQEISTLQNKFEVLSESNKSVVEDYENRLKDLNLILQLSNTEREKEREITNFRILMLNSEFHPQDFDFINNIKIDLKSIYNIPSMPPKIYSFLAKEGFIQTNKSGFNITPTGIQFINFVQKKLNNHEN